jgi:hypothetical protein
MDKIKTHNWLKDLEWGKMATKEALAPFIPDVCLKFINSHKL